jgi:hypothetical protein
MEERSEIWGEVINPVQFEGHGNLTTDDDAASLSVDEINFSSIQYSSLSVAEILLPLSTRPYGNSTKSIGARMVPILLCEPLILWMLNYN